MVETQHAMFISIHALHEESDTSVMPRSMSALLFQSTLSMRRATELSRQRLALVVISIHALHEESDPTGLVVPELLAISIHALHEESDHGGLDAAQFLTISIHALHEESDSRLRPMCR